MRLDIRIPLGLLFTLTGGLLLAFGLLSGLPINALGSVNINAAWGAVLLVFGLCMLRLSLRRWRWLCRVGRQKCEVSKLRE